VSQFRLSLLGLLIIGQLRRGFTTNQHGQQQYPKRNPNKAPHKGKTLSSDDGHINDNALIGIFKRYPVGVDR
jgi:hypothetical protein